MTADLQGISRAPVLSEHNRRLAGSSLALMGTHACNGDVLTACITPTRRDRELRALLEQTVLNGERHSLLLVGPRGSGKSWVRVYCILTAFP